MQTKYNVGDKVTILAEWQDAGDADVEWTVTKVNGDRLSLTCSGFEEWAIKPLFNVTENMIDHA